MLEFLVDQKISIKNGLLVLFNIYYKHEIYNYCNFEIDDQSRTKVFVCQSDDLRKLNIRIEGYCRNRWAGEQGEFYTRLREV